MLNLIPVMLEKVGIIVIVAFLLSKMDSFRQIIHPHHNLNERLKLFLLFGMFGIISNYTGIEVFHSSIEEVRWLSTIGEDSAIANTRVMGVVIGGLLGGPIVGAGAGLIAGIHRYSLGGFTAFACGLSTILAGMLAGFIGKKRADAGKQITPLFAACIGMSLEALQMLMIILIAKPFENAWGLVQFIGIPMITMNGFGTLLFMLIVQSMKRDGEIARANQTNQAFLIADQTLPHFRQGLNSKSCKEISKIMLSLTEADAVSITDENLVLSHLGAASDHHKPNTKPSTGLTKRALESGNVSIAKSKEEIDCQHEGCPLLAAIVLPLKVNKKILGTLKLYYTKADKLDKVQQELAEGLANLFSTQLELAEAEKQARLLKDAEIKALQAQIHPHFLFNSLNTISALCRTDPVKARELLLELSLFFRGNLQGARQVLIPLEKELENVNAYLILVQTRFPNKYEVDFDIEDGLEKVLIPPFLLQPLVENAVHYAFPHRKQYGKISIQVFLDGGYMTMKVADNGQGIAEERVRLLSKQVVPSNSGSGTAIFNISERLKGIYNNQAHFIIDSTVDVGTTIKIFIPLESKGGDEQDAESLCSG